MLAELKDQLIKLNDTLGKSEDLNGELVELGELKE